MARWRDLSNLAHVFQPPFQSAQELLSELYREDFDVTGQGQRQRILDRLKQGGLVPMPELHRVGSGKANGFCASLTRRISEIREQGYNVICHKETLADGTINTEYEMQPTIDQPLLHMP